MLGLDQEIIAVLVDHAHDLVHALDLVHVVRHEAADLALVVDHVTVAATVVIQKNHVDPEHEANRKRN